VAFDGTTPKTLSNAITVAASGGRIEVAADDQLTLAGTVVRTGTLTKTGAGTLASGTLPTTNLAIASGTYLYTGTSTTNIGGDLGGMFRGGVLAISSSNARINLNVNQTGTGAIVFTQPGQSLAQNGSLTNLNVTVANPIVLELPTGSINIGTTSTSNTLILNAAISGTGDVRFAAGPSSTSGIGVTVLNAASTFTGNVVVDSGSTGVHRLGVANAIPVTAGVNFDGTSGVIDLAGNDQRITYLTGGTSANPGGFVNSSSSAATLTVNGTANTEFSGRIGSTGSAAIALVKAGVGSLTLAGTNAYTGATTINGGILSVNGVNGPSVITVNNLGTLAGTGTAGGAVVNSGGTLSPGASPGTFTLTGDLSLSSGGNYNWQMLSGTGTAGDPSSWDLVSVGGALTVASTSADPFKINLWTLSATGPDVNGDAINFDASQNYTWKIATASGGITGFAANKFAISTSSVNGTGGFSNPLAGGTFSVAQSGNDLNLVFTASGGTPTVITINVASGTQTQGQAGYPLLSGTTPVVKTGGGTLVVDQANTLTGSTAVQGGVLQLANGSALGSSTLAVVAGGTAQVADYLMTTVGGLDLAGGGLFDVTSGFVTVAGGLSAADLVTQILAGRGDGSWNGTSGITSSTAAAAGALGAARAVGWLDNGDGSLAFAYAAPGDTNLDWQVDVLDAANVLASGKFNTGDPATWAEGDFNYDGVVDVLDAADFITTGLYNDGAYNPPSGVAEGVAAVPEPSLLAAGLAAVAMAFTTTRRRRR
jgi:autotransporter-associated beta strand protein